MTVGSSSDLSFTVTNIGSGTLTGTATTTSTSFSVASGGSFSLTAGASQTVTVRFSPTSTGTFTGTASVSSNGGSASVSLSGTGTAPADTIPPTVTITTPTSASTYTTSSSPLTVGGTASDNVGVTQVTWSNAATGTSGTASGTTSWTASGITLLSGTNLITVTAKDAAGNTGTDTLTVTYTPADTTPPTITITSPTTDATYTTTTSSLTLGGTASDNVGGTQVTWSNDRGGSGTATGTTSWSAGPITLQSGTNVLTVTAQDAAGNTGTDTLSVTYTPDSDGDDIPDSQDNCPAVANSDQSDADKDSVGDACDNCPFLANSDQTDTDEDGVGDLCEALIAGGGDPTTDCFAEWLIENPFNTLSPWICTDGDPTCDFGTVEGQCSFEVTLCFNNIDPELSTCSPTDVASVTLRKPNPLNPKDTADTTNVMALEETLVALGGEVVESFVLFSPSLTDIGTCTEFLFVVPVESKVGIKPLKVEATSSAGSIDADSLRLICLPGS